MTVARGQYHVQEYVWDFAEDGGATGTIDLSAKSGYAVLPQGAVVEDVWMKVITAVTSGGSMTLETGNTTDDNGYIVSQAVASLVDELVTDGPSLGGDLIWDDTNDHAIRFLVNSANDADFVITVGTAAATAGKIRFFVRYYMPLED